MKSMSSVTRLALAVLTAGAILGVEEAQAFRMIQNTTVGRVSAGYQVRCDDPGGFTHWNTSSIPWYHNTANQGAGKATQIQNGLNSWTNVAPATHTLTYAGTTTAGFVTDGLNTVVWATGNGCTGSCLAITALVLASGQVITETDVSFNNSVTWTTNGSNYDTEAVWAHEAGHALGIHHTEKAGPTNKRPTMYAYYFGSAGRTLETDDKDALNCAYNRYPPAGANLIAGGAELSGARPATGAAVRLASRPRPGGALIRFALPEDGEVKLQVFDVAGRHITTLAQGHRAAGEHEIAWSGEASFGHVSSGLYFARLSTPSGRARTTVILAE